MFPSLSIKFNPYPHLLFQANTRNQLPCRGFPDAQQCRRPNVMGQFWVVLSLHFFLLVRSNTSTGKIYEMLNPASLENLKSEKRFDSIFVRCAKTRSCCCIQELVFVSFFRDTFKGHRETRIPWNKRLVSLPPMQRLACLGILKG